MSFGHALYVAVGAYSAELAIKDRHCRWARAALLAIAIGAVVAALLGAVSLKGVGNLGHRVRHGHPGVRAGRLDPGRPRPGEPPAARKGCRWTHREGARRRSSAWSTPSTCTGWRWRTWSWSAACVWWLTGSRTGRVLAGAPRQRAAHRGARPEPVPLQARRVRARRDARRGRRRGVPAGHRRRHARRPRPPTSPWRCWSWWCSAGPARAGARCSAASSTRYLDHRLGAVATSDCGRRPAGVLRIPLSQPLVLLGVLFVLVVYAVPGGLAALPRRLGYAAGEAPASASGRGARRPEAPEDSEANSTGSAWSRASRTAPIPTASPPSSDTRTSGGYRQHLAEQGPDRLGEVLAGLRQAAADHHQVRVQRRHQADQPFGQRPGERLERRGGLLLARGRALASRTARPATAPAARPDRRPSRSP